MCYLHVLSSCAIFMYYLPTSAKRSQGGISLLEDPLLLYSFYNPLNSDMDYGIFSARTDVNACDCTQGCTDTGKEYVLKVDSGRKILRRNGESNLCQRRSGPTLYRLNNIPISIRRSNQQAHTFWYRAFVGSKHLSRAVSVWLNLKTESWNRSSRWLVHKGRTCQANLILQIPPPPPRPLLLFFGLTPTVQILTPTLLYAL